MHALAGRVGKAAMSPEQVEDLRDRAAAQTIAINGAFDQRISELKVERGKLEAAQTIVKTIADAEKIRAAAVAEAERTTAEATAKIRTAQERLDGLLTDIGNAESARDAAMRKAAEGAKALVRKAHEEAAAITAGAEARLAELEAKVEQAKASATSWGSKAEAAKGELAALESRIAAARDAAAKAFGVG